MEWSWPDCDADARLKTRLAAVISEILTTFVTPQGLKVK